MPLLMDMPLSLDTPTTPEPDSLNLTDDLMKMPSTYGQGSPLSTQSARILDKGVNSTASGDHATVPEARRLHVEDSELSVTRLLHEWKSGNPDALDVLTPIVYDELLRIARRQLRAERDNHTLAPTALVHEAWMKMLSQKRADWRDRSHFFALAARFMRRILVDYSRNHKAQKRGGAAVKISMDEGFEVGQSRDASICALDDALTALAQFDERKAKVVELRYFGGLTAEEIATQLEVSVATVGREIRMAQAWLHREMSNTLPS